MLTKGKSPTNCNVSDHVSDDVSEWIKQLVGDLRIIRYVSGLETTS